MTASALLKQSKHPNAEANVKGGWGKTIGGAAASWSG